MTVSVFDVAEYILSKLGEISAMKLQKLVYYAQAWHLVWEDKELFPEVIQAWANGPVVPVLYYKHAGRFSLSAGSFDGTSQALSKESTDVIDKVLSFYGQRDAQWLSDLTHMEDPWKLARKDLSEGERGDNVITNESMLEYYSNIR